MSPLDSGHSGAEQHETMIRETFGFRWRFPFVIVAALLLTVAHPLSKGLSAGQATFDILCSLLIMTVMVLVFEEQRHRRMALPPALFTLLAMWTSRVVAEPLAHWLHIAANLAAAGFIAFAFYGIVSELILLRLTRHAVLGAVCGYLLLGILWMLLYLAVETAVPGSFRISAEDDLRSAGPQSVRDLLGYFSFITLATVGYGDVTPVTPIARTLAWLEAVVGQFYLGVLVAGLVGFKVTQALDQKNVESDRG